MRPNRKGIRMTRFVPFVASFLALTCTAFADVALIVGNEDYTSLRDLRDGSDVVAAGDAYERLGFDVIALENASSVELRDALSRFVAGSVEAERVLVVLSGRFLHSGQEAWMLGVDQGARPDLAGLAGGALPMSAILAVLAGHPGKALVVIGEDAESGASGSPYLDLGLGALDLPQGVTLMRGGARAVAGFAEDVLPLPALSETVVAAQRQGLVVSGYAPEDFRFVVASAPPNAPSGAANSADEASAWKATRAADAVAAYRDYIRRFPDGPNVAEANRLIRAIEAEPNRPARLAEEALGLSRDQRRAVQRDLSILDIDPRGIDGLFGSGSRAAISRWQTQNGLNATGYLTRDQVARLDAQGARRAAELEAEAEARKLEQERQDRAYWAATGAAGDEPGLRSYLKRYPDGVFAEVAQTRLEVYQEQKRAAAAQADRTAWDQAKATGTVAAYRNYLEANPEGAFAQEARARIEDQTEETSNEQENDAARQQEAALNLNRQTRSLIEGRLDALGLKPGKVDGDFDKGTRRAIRRYQKARDLPVTGFLSQQTVVRILADSILR